VIETIRQALVLQAETDLAYATAQERAAFAVYEDALQAFEEEAEATGHTAPDVQLNVLNRRYLDAEEDDADEEELATIRAEIVEVQAVQRLRDVATDSLDRWGSAQAQLSDAQGRLDAALTAPVQGGDVVRLSKLQSMIKQGAYAALFGAALAVGFVIIVELLRSGTGTSRPNLPRPTRQRTRAGAF